MSSAHSCPFPGTERAELMIGDGDLAHVPVDGVHAFRAVGDEEARFLNLRDWDGDPVPERRTRSGRARPGWMSGPAVNLRP